MQAQPQLFRPLIIDNFAGGGGTSCGIESATGRSPDIAINHDQDAIAMHTINHPETDHFCESVWDVDPLEVTRGLPVDLCWLSPDCKHFSKAKGGKPVEKKIRGLAWVGVRWALMARPRVLMLENVEEFLTWGPVVNGQPCPDNKGRTFEAFVAVLRDGLTPRHPDWLEVIRTLGVEFDLQAKLKLFRGLGYQVDTNILVASDYGAPTIRKRLFLVARCDGQPITWPEATHASPCDPRVRKGKLKPWKTAADCIDWSKPAPSIFGRKRPLAEKTMQRIARGLKKFVLESERPFVVPVEGEGGQVAPFVTEHANGSSQRNMSIEQPLRTVCAQVKGGHFALVTAFLAKHFGGGYTGAGVSLTDPAHTVTTKDHHALVTSHMIKMRGTGTGFPTDEPVHTITAGGLHIGEVRAFLLKYYGTNIGLPADEPLHTVTTKARFGLVTIEGSDYQIVDIGMRMLTPRELFRAQGFRESYVIDRDQYGNRLTIEKQVARCGNAVPPDLAEALVRANLPELCIQRKGDRKAA